MEGMNVRQDEPKCAFTGHRVQKLGLNRENGGNLLRQKLRDAVLAVYESGIRHFICGMAQGCDMYFAETVLALKAVHPDIVLEAAVPFPGQADRWSEPLRRHYEYLLSRCDLRTVLQREFTPSCMMRRNRYMVDRADVLIAVYNGSPGGTRNTLLYAMRRGVRIVEITL